MIKSFRHKGVEAFFKTGSRAGINPAHASQLKRQLGQLNESTQPENMKMSGATADVWLRMQLAHDLWQARHGANLPKVSPALYNAAWLEAGQALAQRGPPGMRSKLIATGCRRNLLPSIW